MKFYICISLSALFGYVLGAIMATGANADHCANKVNGDCRVWECRFVPREGR